MFTVLKRTHEMANIPVFVQWQVEPASSSLNLFLLTSSVGAYFNNSLARAMTQH